jgi:ribosome-binding protein aMBF1 (putative translation factor)
MSIRIKICGNIPTQNIHDTSIIIGMSRGRRPSELTIKFGKRIESLRKKRGWDQADLTAHTGIERGHISEIENGKRMINLATLQKLAKGLNTSMAMLLRGL